jgi:hypothetical protein
MRWRAEGGPARWQIPRDVCARCASFRWRCEERGPRAAFPSNRHARAAVQPGRSPLESVVAYRGRGSTPPGRPARVAARRQLAQPGLWPGVARARVDVAVGALNANVEAVDLRSWRCDRKRGADEASSAQRGASFARWTNGLVLT